jgi:hypothetical protein|nr:hypothetical protein [uncultured Actinomyces sp.]DAE91123.1 MAG TPA: hypothetical protein [Caudoviricetes sp.]
MAEWPESHVVVILEAEARGTSIPRGTVAIRDPEDGMYLATGTERGRLWLDPRVDRITSWIDIGLGNVVSVDGVAAPGLTPLMAREKIMSEVLSLEDNGARNSPWWPTNELAEVDNTSSGSVAQAVLSAYYECSYFADNIASKAVEAMPVTFADVRSAALKVAAASSADTIDDYAVKLTAYWLQLAS